MAIPAWKLEKQLAEARAREEYYANTARPNPTGPVNQRGETTTLYYRSLIFGDGVEPFIYQVDVVNDLLTDLTAADLGLNATLGVNETALRLRGSGVKPSKIHYYRGLETPARNDTPWGSQTIKYYDGPIRSAPFSQASGAFGAQDLRARFDGFFGGGGSKRNLLGPRNGRAWLEFETASVAYQN